MGAAIEADRLSRIWRAQRRQSDQSAKLVLLAQLRRRAARRTGRSGRRRRAASSCPLRDDTISELALDAIYSYWQAHNATSSGGVADDPVGVLLRLELGRAAVPDLSGALRRLGRRGELVLRQLAGGGTRADAAGGAARPILCRGAIQRFRRSRRSVGRRMCGRDSRPASPGMSRGVKAADRGGRWRSTTSS